MSYPYAQNTFSRSLSLNRDFENLINMPQASNQYRELFERIRQEPNQYRKLFKRMRQEPNQYRELFQQIQRENLTNPSFFIHKIQKTPPQLPPPVLNLPSIIPNDVNWGKISKLINADIPEDSIYRKLLACIPIIGIIPAVLNERSLLRKITQTKESTRFVKLVNIKNHYKFASIARKLLSIALIITCVALPLLSWPIGVAAGVIGSGFLAYYAYGIYKNKQIMKTLDTANLPINNIK